MKYNFFSIDKQDGVGIVVFDNPPVNTLSFEVLGEMEMVFDEVERAQDIKVMILASGNERIFGGGADLNMINKMLSSPSYIYQVSERIIKSFDKPQFMPKPVIASINGHATGGGCEISLACDFRFMAKGPWKIGQTEVLLGLLPGAGGTQRMTRLLGRTKAAELLLTGRLLTPDEALKIGLVDKLFEQKDLMKESIDFGRKLAQGRRKLWQI